VNLQEQLLLALQLFSCARLDGSHFTQAGWHCNPAGFGRVTLVSDWRSAVAGCTVCTEFLGYLRIKGVIYM